MVLELAPPSLPAAADKLTISVITQNGVVVLPTFTTYFLQPSFADIK